MKGERVTFRQYQQVNVRRLIYVSLFTALIAVGAFIKIPVPVVPFTLQFLFTTLAGLLLGCKDGSMCVGVYILLGLLGIPVFAEGGGLLYLLKPSFGYIIGFFIAAYVTGMLAKQLARFTVKRLLIINFIGLFIVYAIGIFYYYIIGNYIINTPIGVWTLFIYGFVLAVPGDICLCVIAAFLAKQIKPFVNIVR